MISIAPLPLGNFFEFGVLEFSGIWSLEFFKMTFLPIVARELRVASRRRSTYWVRTGAATGVIALGTFFFLMMQREQSTPHEIAKVLFGILTGCAVLYSL